jgi:electron transport complex protein RnfD
MIHVLIALAPLSVWGVILYGIPALAVILVSVIAAVAGEALFRLVTRQEFRAPDCSAVVSGLLLALILPPSTPLWMAALGSVFAVVVAKEFFGGLGANVFNPALSGRAFLLMSFPVFITRWTMPAGIDALSAASETALDAAAAAPAADAALEAVEAVSAASGALALDSISGATPLGIIKMGGAVSDAGRQLAAAGLSSGEDYLSVMRTLFIGNHAGSIGESSILLIAAGCIYLLAMKIINWRAPLAMIASAFVFSFILRVDPLFSVLAGGLCFGAVFMATDYTTAPLSASGKLIFGAGAGIITVLIRKWGNYPEGVTYGLLIMNAVTPFLNRLLQRKYGYVKPLTVKSGAAEKPESPRPGTAAKQEAAK